MVRLNIKVKAYKPIQKSAAKKVRCKTKKIQAHPTAGASHKTQTVQCTIPVNNSRHNRFKASGGEGGGIKDNKTG